MGEGSDPKDRTGRTAEVLDASFLDGLSELSVDELRRRRDRALAEREFQSYLRRLVQTRQDLLAAEQERRRSGAPPRPVVERLTAVLSEGPQGRGRGEALRLRLPEEDADEAERRADALVPSRVVSATDELDDDGLRGAIERLDAGERAVSSDRAAVLRVHDRLQEELKLRYRDDPSSIPTEIVR